MEHGESPYEPTSLRDAIVYFSKPENCLKYMVAKRWPNGVTCPTCGNADVSFLVNQQRWQCGSHHPRRQFSIKTGTIFEDSPLGLDKWLPCIWLVTNCKNGVSSWEIHRALEVTQKTAWFMLHRIRLAMQDNETAGKPGGQIEVDETFIGGKSRNMHRHVRARNITGTGGKDKTAVMGILQRGGKEWQRQVAPIYEAKANSLWQAIEREMIAEVNDFDTAVANPERKVHFDKPDAALITVKKLTFPQQFLSVRPDIPAHRITFSVLTTLTILLNHVME